MGWSADANLRVGRNGLETFFPQVGVQYKLTKWLRTSVEYRFVLDKNKYGNYKSSSSIRVNLILKENIKRFDFGLRLRYQNSFKGSSGPEYNADFGQAIRIKPSVEYDIDNSVFTPFLNTEFFFDPAYGPQGPGFNKIRYAIGTKLELDSPHGISVKYQLDHKLNRYPAALKHVVSVGYSYEF